MSGGVKNYGPGSWGPLCTEQPTQPIATPLSDTAICLSTVTQDK